VTRLRLCRCAKVHVPVGTLCPECRRKRNKAHDARRPPASQRGYGTAWRKLRAEVLAMHPYCSQCGHPGSEDNRLSLDHILPRSQGGDDRLENLRVLCMTCNRAREAGSSPVAVSTRLPDRPVVSMTDTTSTTDDPGWSIA
jgi:5-methylcytosine-specific restriction protein A